MAKRRKIPTPSWEHSDSGTLARRLESNRWQLFGTAGVILLVLAALGVVGWAFLSDWIADQQRPGSTAIEVADQKYSVRDFSKRTQLYADENGGQNNALIVIPTVANQLIEEAVLLQFAEAEGVTATDEEIRAQIATNLGIGADDPNFDARLQEELTATGLSDEEYTNLAKGRVLKANLTEKFKNDVPETLPSIHIRQLRVSDQATADEVVAELNDGADFATVFIENSLDYDETAEEPETGDEGFVPEGFLSDETLEGILFGLEDGEYTTYPTQSSITVYQVLEHSDIQEPTDDQKNQLAANAYSDWYSEKRESLDIKNDLDFQEGDSKKISWIIDHAELVVQQ